MPFEIEAGGVDIPDGTYKATLEKVEVTQGTFNGKAGDIRIWHFLADVAGELTPISSTSSMGTGPKTKAFAWLTALNGAAPQIGTTVEDPIGKMVLLTVGHTDHQGNPTQFPKIKQLTQYVEPAQAVAGVPR
jgi:hypothetical protein